MKYIECERCGRWTPRISVIGNASAAVFKFIVGSCTGSKGLVADALHSIADTISSLFILISLRIAKKPKDAKHPFGYGKVEYLSTVFASLLIFLCAATIFIDSLHSFRSGIHRVPGNGAMVATIIAFFYSYLMASSNKCAGTQLRSPALLADAAESKADCLASAAVLLGLIGTRVGYVYADTIAAAVVSLFVFHISMEMFLKGVNGMMDLSADKEVIAEIANVTLDVKGVKGIREINTRGMGRKCLVEICVDVLRTETVIGAHEIAERVRNRIVEKIDGIDDVFVKTFPSGKWNLGLYGR